MVFTNPIDFTALYIYARYAYILYNCVKIQAKSRKSLSSLKGKFLWLRTDDNYLIFSGTNFQYSVEQIFNIQGNKY